MRSKEIEKFVGWAESTRTTAGRRGMLVEIKEGKILLLNRERTVALLSRVGGSENLRFYSDEYPLGKYPDITTDGENTIFSWDESGAKRTVSFPLPEKSFFDEVSKTFEEQRKVEGETRTHRTIEFSKLLDDMKFTTLEFTLGSTKMIQTDPRGISSETEIKNDVVTSKVDRW